MPKMKTHKGAAKRFSRTGTGKFKRNQAMRRHILTKKTSKHKRQLRRQLLVAPGDAKRLKRMLDS